MGKIELWKDEYRICEEKIDAQHEELFHKIEELLVMASSADLQANLKQCEKMLNYLIEYTVFHFDTEEALQNRKNYIDYGQHKKIHQDFRNTVVSYHQTIREDFSAATLKRFLGTLLTWLTVHVQGCDRKIMKNEPIVEPVSLTDAEQIIGNVMKKLLMGMYKIEIREMTTCRYYGEIKGDVIVRTRVSGKQEHMLLYGLPERLARALYNKISGLFINDMEQLDELEESALVEIGEIMSSYIMGLLSDEKITDYTFRGDLFLSGYQEDVYNMDNVVVKMDTKYGTIEVLYCRL